MNCNTYKSEITNKGYTLDGCRLDALNSVSSSVWSGSERSTKIIHSEKLFLCGLINQKKGRTSHGDATSHHDAMIPRDDPVSRRSKNWYDSDQMTEICHQLQPADPVANHDR